jgi:hypothetical protein
MLVLTSVPSLPFAIDAAALMRLAANWVDIGQLFAALTGRSPTPLATLLVALPARAQRTAEPERGVAGAVGWRWPPRW